MKRMARCWIALALLTQTAGVSAQQPAHRSYDALVEAYAKGDADTAVAELATWNAIQIEREALGSRRPEFAVNTLRAIALLHIEAAMLQRTRNLIAAHLRDARLAIAALRSQSGTDAFCVGWQVVASSYLMSVGLTSEAKLIPPSPEPELLLLAGSITEAAAGGPALVARSRAFRAGIVSRNDVNVRLFEAEEKYRAALKVAPHLVEARVRLGRVLYLERRDNDARTELERARKEAGTGFERYLAALFLGTVHERAGRLAAAGAAYREAIGEYPESQTAYLALAHLLEKQSDRDAAWETLRTMVQPRDERVDPWWVYEYAQFWQIETRLVSLRTQVRQ